LQTADRSRDSKCVTLRTSETFARKPVELRFEFSVREDERSVSFCISGQARDRMAIEDLAAWHGVAMPEAELRADLRPTGLVKDYAPKDREVLRLRLALLSSK
jgi:hypothetical protein